MVDIYDAIILANHYNEHYLRRFFQNKHAREFCMLCGKPLNGTMIVEETDAQSLRDEVTTLREELNEALKGYNELTKLGTRLTK